MGRCQGWLLFFLVVVVVIVGSLNRVMRMDGWRDCVMWCGVCGMDVMLGW